MEQDTIIPIELLYNNFIWSDFSCINLFLRSCKLLRSKITPQISKLIAHYSIFAEKICEDGKCIEYQMLPNNKQHGVSTIYNKQDRVIEQGVYANAKLEGKYTVIISKRNKHYVIYNYVNGQRNGEFVEMRGDRILEKGCYLAGELHGEYICYFENGAVASMFQYDHGNFNGNVIQYFIDGQISSFSQYNDGVLNGKHYVRNHLGEYKEFFIYKNGIIIDFKNCTYTNGADEQITITITPVGENLRLTKTNQAGVRLAEWTIDKYGDRQGMYREWANNVLTYECNYVDDLRDGKLQICNDVGVLIYTTTYKLDKPISDEITYFDNGVVDKIVPYVNGQREGIKQKFNDQGQLLQITTYKNNYKNGLQIRYRADGSKRSQCNFYHNRLHGLKITYNAQGEPLTTTEYYMGEKIKNPGKMT
ncbi:phophatidylinositol-4-phosphate 5-kinase [Faustovirus]|nr:phophatidylinositol-4-phosphate 5-kinase [Faustovirus]